MHEVTKISFRTYETSDCYVASRFPIHDSRKLTSYNPILCKDPFCAYCKSALYRHRSYKLRQCLHNLKISVALFSQFS